jgi:hypothetical protein
MVTRFGDVFVFVFLVSGTLGVNFYTQTIGFRIGFACNSHWIVERRCFNFNNMRDEHPIENQIKIRS